MTEKPKKFKTKLIVKSQEPVGSFERNGNTVTIYSVEAVNEQGERVDKKLRTFHEELPVGELTEFEVEPYPHKDFGLTYTLKLITRGRASKKDVAELTRQITDIASRMTALEGEMAALRKEVQKGKPLDEHLSEKAPWD